MTNENTTLPAVLANSTAAPSNAAEAERAAFARILTSDSGSELMLSLQIDVEALPCIEDFGDYHQRDHADAVYILGNIDDAMEAARGIVYGLTALREAYVNALPTLAATIPTRTIQLSDLAATLTDAAMIASRNEPERRDEFIGAVRDTLIFFTGGDGEDDESEADFIEGGPFRNVEPEFVEMTPEDEASIQGKAA